MPVWICILHLLIKLYPQLRIHQILWMTGRFCFPQRNSERLGLNLCL